MGGFVMPIGCATVPDTSSPVLGDLHEGYQRVGCALDVVVDDHRLELPLGGQLDLGDLEAPPHAVLVLGATSGQPALQLVERWWCEEHQVRLRHPRLDLPGALELDLQ